MVVFVVVVATGVAERLNPVPVVIMFGVPNVRPVAAVDAVASPPPKVNPPVSGLDAKAVVIAVVVVAVVVPPKLKLKVLPAGAGTENPVGVVVVVAAEVIPVLVVVPVLNVKPGVCATVVLAIVAFGVPKLKPVAGAVPKPLPNPGLVCAGIGVSEKSVGFAASPAPAAPNVKAKMHMILQNSFIF